MKGTVARISHMVVYMWRAVGGGGSDIHLCGGGGGLHQFTSNHYTPQISHYSYDPKVTVTLKLFLNELLNSGTETEEPFVMHKPYDKK